MKRQRKLDTFFSGTLSTRNYFYFDWSTANPTAKWLFTRPTNINFEVEVKWNDAGTHITVCGLTNNAKEEQEQKPESQIDTPTLSLLKSHLQKCIRRGFTKKALETSCFLIKYDLNAFIRRLPIIMMEDVKVHISFIPLVWLTAAISKGFRVTEIVKSWLLGVVKYLCEEQNEYYYHQNVSSYTEDQTLSTKQLLKETEKFEPTTRDLLISLLFRKSYGGMKGDMEMIAAYERVFVKLGPLSKNNDAEIVKKKVKTDSNVENDKVIIDLDEEEAQPSRLVSLVPIGIYLIFSS